MLWILHRDKQFPEEKILQAAQEIITYTQADRARAIKKKQETNIDINDICGGKMQLLLYQ